MEFMDHGATPAPPTRHDEWRVVLHFDYDYFYGAVVEKQQPALKGLPLGIKQKSLLATCNYEARRLGVKKLMSISEAKKLCPELVLVSGEDLSPFRAVSKRLYQLIRSYSWSQKVERLGLDEVFFDATDLVEYNLDLLNPHDLAQSFFCLSQSDPEQGFIFDATAFAGCVLSSASDEPRLVGQSQLRLLVASHLARHIRLRVEEEGYTSVCGISTNKALSKIAGTKNKPRNQTVLLSNGAGDVEKFMDPLSLREVPGIGSRIQSILASHLDRKTDGPTTVADVRTSPAISLRALEHWLDPRTGRLVWDLLHGIDASEVKKATDVPTQISIEDTYQGLTEMDEIRSELRKLTGHLLERMRLDLLDEERWLARPRTLRLSTRPKTLPAEDKPYNYARKSKSQPLPSFVLNAKASIDELVDRLLDPLLLPMFFQMTPEKRSRRVGMLNVCVTNMVPTGTEDGSGLGRNISSMLRGQDEALRQWTVYDAEPPNTAAARPDVDVREGEDKEVGAAAEEDWIDERENALIDRPPTDDDALERCHLCGHFFPGFAAAAHARYHSIENG